MKQNIALQMKLTQNIFASIFPVGKALLWRGVGNFLALILMRICFSSGCPGGRVSKSSAVLSIEELIRFLILKSCWWDSLWYNLLHHWWRCRTSKKMVIDGSAPQPQARVLCRVALGAELSGASALPAVQGEELCRCSAQADGADVTE